MLCLNSRTFYRMLMTRNICSSSSTSQFFLLKANKSSHIFRRYAQAHICYIESIERKRKKENRSKSTLKLSFSKTSFFIFFSRLFFCLSETSIYIIDFRWIDLLSVQKKIMISIGFALRLILS